MKKLLLILLCLPMIGFGQKYGKCVSGDCENGTGTWLHDNNERYPTIKYKGQFKNGLFHGYGMKLKETLRSDGSPDRGKFMQYIGEFKKGLMKGLGVMTYPNGHKIVGEFKDDSPLQAIALPKRIDEEVYVGEWKEWLEWGEGICVYPDGMVEKGKFRMNFIEGACFYPDGRLEKGIFDGGLMIDGTIFYPDGTVEKRIVIE